MKEELENLIEELEELQGLCNPNTVIIIDDNSLIGAYTSAISKLSAAYSKIDSLIDDVERIINIKKIS